MIATAGISTAFANPLARGLNKVDEVGSNWWGRVFGRTTIAASETNVYSHGFEYADRIRVRALEDPVSHNFPYSFDNSILSTDPIIKNNGYRIFQQEGSMNNKNGFYEIGIARGNVIDHRFFKPN